MTSSELSDFNTFAKTIFNSLFLYTYKTRYTNLPIHINKRGLQIFEKIDQLHPQSNELIDNFFRLTVNY